MPDLDLGHPGMSVIPLGVGDAFSAIHYPACMLVSRYQNPAWDEEMLLIDCPQSIRKMMYEADGGRFGGLDLHRVSTILLTHLHADHASGLETIAAFFKVVLNRQPRLVALPEVLEEVPRFLKDVKHLGVLDDFFDVMPICAGPESQVQLGTELEGATFIKAYRTKHPTPTAAFRITRGNQTFAYSADTALDLDLWKWLWDDDPGLVVHEVGHGGPHTSYWELRERLRDDRRGGLASCTRLDRLRLTHYTDDLISTLGANVFLGGPLPLEEGKLEIVAG